MSPYRNSLSTDSSHLRPSTLSNQYYAQKWSTFLDKVIKEGKDTNSFMFGIGVDASDYLLNETAFIPTQFSLPTDFSFIKIQELFETNTDIQTHYKNLSITASGLIWESHGYNFILDFNGDLTFFAQSESITDFAYDESLRIVNPYGNVYIGAQVPTFHLQVKAQNVFYHTNVSPIERLDIWATGTSTAKGIGSISGESTLKTREIYQHLGVFHQNGTLHNDETLKLFLSEGGFNNGSITSGNALSITTNGIFVNNQTISAHGKMALNGQGSIQNNHLLSTQGAVTGTLFKLINSAFGTLSAGTGFSNFYLHSLINDGVISGGGSIQIKRGVNRNLWTSNNLQLFIDEEFIHERGGLKADEYIRFEGKGSVYHKSIIEAPLLEVAVKKYELQSKSQKDGVHSLVIKEENDDFKIHEDSSVTLKHLETEKNKAGKFLNNGDLTVTHLINRRSFRNNGELDLTTLNHVTRAAFTNGSEGHIMVSGETHIETDNVENEGEWTFKGAVHGIIKNLQNKTKSAFLRFEGDTTLQADTLHNQGTLIGHKLFKWDGRYFQNDHRLFLYDNQVSVAEQFYNAGFVRWVHNNVRANHYLNTGYSERNSVFDTTEASVPRFEAKPAMDASFKANTFENYGTVNTTNMSAWTITVTDVTRAHILNYGMWHIDTGILTATQSLVNTGAITSQGKMTLNAPRVKNANSLASRDSISIQATEFDGTAGRILSEKSLDIKADRVLTDANTLLSGTHAVTIDTKSPFENKGTVHSDGKLTFTGSKTINHGKILGSHLSFSADIENSGEIKGKRLDQYGLSKLINKQGGDITVGNYTVDQRLSEILNHGRLIIDSTDALKVDVLNNYHVFSIKKDHYTINRIYNHENAEMIWSNGARLTLGDVINHGLWKASAHFKLTNLHGVTKLGKVMCGGQLIIETPDSAVNPIPFVLREMNNWHMQSLQIKAGNFDIDQHFISPVPLTLNVTHFTNQSLLQAPKLTINSQTFRNGTSQSIFGDIKTFEEAIITVQEDVINQYGRINVGELLTVNGETIASTHARSSELRGILKIKSVHGSIRNGEAIDESYSCGWGHWSTRPRYRMNDAYMSAGKLVELDAFTEINNHYGTLMCDDLMTLKAGSRIITTTGKIYSVGPMRFISNAVEITFGGIHKKTIHDDRFWNTRYDEQFISPPSDVMGGSNIHFDVNSLTIRGSHVTSFRRIYDQNGDDRTKHNPGYFYLENYNCYHHAQKNAGDKFGGGIHNPHGSNHLYQATLSSASGVSFNFAHNVIQGLVTAANASFDGDHLNIGFDNSSISSCAIQLGTGGRYNLADAINTLLGGAIQKRSIAQNPYAVYGTGHSFGPGISYDHVVEASAYSLEDLFKRSEHNPTIRRQLFDKASMLFATQSLFMRVMNKGYLYPHQGAQEHFDILTGDAIKRSHNTMYLSLEDATNAQSPMLTFTEALLDDKEKVLVPYITIPQSFINGDLAHPGGGIVSEGTVKTNMSQSTTVIGGIVSGDEDVDMYSNGTFHTQTLKHAHHWHADDTSGVTEFLGPKTILKSKNGSLNNISRSTFTSIGTTRHAGKDAVVGSLEAYMQRLYVACQRVTTTVEDGGFCGTDRTTTEIREVDFLSDSITAGGNITAGSLRKLDYLSQAATQDTAGGDIDYVYNQLNDSSYIGINSVSTTADGTFRSTSSHNETPTVHLSSSMAGGNVIFNGAESAHVSGKLISAHDLIDLTPVTFFGPSVNEMKSGRSVESSTGVGYSSRTLDSGQEVVVPTVIMLSGKFKSTPAPDKKSRSKLTLQAVELSAPGGTEILKEHLAEESYEAKTWQTETRQTAGFSAPIVDIATARNPLKAAVDTAVNSTVVGSIKAMEGTQSDLAKGIGALKVANSAVSDAKLAYTAFKDPRKAAMDFLIRFTSVSFGVSSVTSHMEAFQNMPTHIKTAWFYFDGKIWNHDGGAKLDATKVIVPNAEEITMRSGTHRMNAETTAESASISVNPLALANPATYAAAGSVNVSEQSSTQSQTIHDHATILADYVFIRSKNMLVTGASVRSKVIDVMLEDDLLLESVVNEISQETQGMSVGLSTSMMYGDGVLDKISGLGDMAFSNTESKRRWIEQKTAFIATEQLYLTVGKNYITRSAHAKREGQDKAPDYHARNAAGNTLRFFERQMPITDNACAFYSLDIKGENGQSVRKSGTDLLLNHSGNEEIRNLLAYEIFDKTINSNEHDLRVLNAILPGMADYRASRETLRSTKSWSDMDALDDTIKQWARNELTYRSYVEGYLSKSNVMLEYFNDTSSFKPMTSSMDALAKIKGYDLNIYVQAQDDTGAYLNDQLTLVHAFKGGDKPINIIHVPHDPKQPQRLNHFNRLEETQDFTKAAHRIEEFFPEENGAVETKSGHDILLPFATVGTFAANVRDGVKWLEAQQFIETERAKNAYQQAKDLGKSEDEARADGENERQEVRAENNIASALNDAVEEEPSSSKTKTSVPRTTMVSDKDLQTWSEALTAALNYDEGTNLGGDFSKRLTNQAKSRHQHYKAQGLSDEQAWTNVRFEIGESIRHLENKPQLHDVVWGVAGKIAIEGFKKLAPRVLEKLGKESAKKAAQEAAKETTKKVSKKAAKEQPWIIRPGQEWKGKVVGKAQKTGTPGHAGQSYKEAIKEAKKPDVEKVFLNRGLKKSSGHPIQKPNNRPDVTIRTKDGKIHQTEVPSKTDKDYLLEKRMDDATSRLPKQMRGDNKLAHIS